MNSTKFKDLFQLWFGMINLKGVEESAEPKTSNQPVWACTAWLIVKCVSTLAITGVIVYRTANAHVHFENFDFTQLLALILALFSMGLSATFYFKATDTSNKFYDQTYRLTKDLFEILGRMDERFAERLEGIHEDTADIRREFMQSGNERRGPVSTTKSVSTPDASISQPREERP